MNLHHYELMVTTPNFTILLLQLAVSESGVRVQTTDHDSTSPLEHSGLINWVSFPIPLGNKLPEISRALLFGGSVSNPVDRMQIFQIAKGNFCL
jgi:hypothetical protein